MRKSVDEDPKERVARLAAQNAQYHHRAAFGWRHPKDRRGPNTRLLQKFKKGPFHVADTMAAMKRDAGFPTIKEELDLSFKSWLRDQSDVKES